jgi:cytochrome c556
MIGWRLRRPPGAATCRDAGPSAASNPNPLETNMKLSSWIGVAAMAAIGMMASAPAAAQFAKAEDAVKYRQSAFTLMGSHFSRIGAVVKGEAPYGPSVATDAKLVETFSHLPFPAFVEDSDKGDTGAKPEIWMNREDFDQKARNMQQAVAALSKVAASGDERALKGAFGDAGKACKACHDEYRRRR